MEFKIAIFADDVGSWSYPNAYEDDAHFVCWVTGVETDEEITNSADAHFVPQIGEVFYVNGITKNVKRIA